MRLVYLSLLVLSAAAYAEDGLHKGENLLQPMPVPGDDWEVSNRTDDRVRSVRWSNSESGESLTTNINSGGGSTVARFREINDEAGKKNCPTFSSRTIDQAETNGYEREIWLAECEKKNGDELTILHQYISGRDSTYYITKIWPSAPDEESLNVWIEYFGTISVCDTRKRRKAPCPELTAVNGN